MENETISALDSIGGGDPSAFATPELDDNNLNALLNPLGEPEVTTPITLEGMEAIDSAVGDRDSHSWLARTALGLADALGTSAAAIAEMPYALADDVGRFFGADLGTREFVRNEMRKTSFGKKVADTYAAAEERHPGVYGFTQLLAEGAFTAPLTNAAVGKVLTKLVKPRIAANSGKVSPFIHGLADSLNIKRGTDGARGAYEAFALSNEGLGWGYKAGHAAKSIAENVANDIVLSGRWSMEQDEATGEYIRNWGAMPGAFLTDAAFGGMSGLWAGHKAIARARTAINEKRYEDARNLLTMMHEHYAKIAGTAATPDGNLARDYMIYKVMHTTEDARVRGQSTINLKESLGKVLDRDMKNVDEQYMERMMQWAYRNADLPQVTEQYRTLRSAKPTDILDPEYADSQFAWIDTRSEKEVAKARNVVREEKINEYVRKHKGTPRDAIPQDVLDDIERAVNEKVPEYSGFNEILHDVGDVLPPEKDYVAVVRLQSPKTSLSISAGLERQNAALKAELQNLVDNSLLAGVDKDIPELVGGLGDASMEMLTNFGKTANRPLKSASMLSSARREAVADPTLHKALNVGELNNNVARSVAHTVGTRHDGLRTMVAELRKDPKAATQFYAEFGRMYDSAGNMGWDIAGIVQTEHGVGLELMDTAYNRMKAEQIGYDLMENAIRSGDGKPVFLMPDVHTLFEDVRPALTTDNNVVKTLNTLFGVEREITKLREIGRLHGDPISSATTAIHFRKPQTPGEHIYRVFKRERYGDQIEHVAFPNEESARRFLEQRKIAGDTSWSSDIIRGGKEFGQVQGAEMETFGILRDTSGEHARGFWQGNQTRATEDILIDIMRQQTASATTAARTAVASSMNNALRTIAGTLSEEAYAEMKQFIRGVMPKNPVLQKIDDATEALFERMYGYGRADKKALKDKDLLHAIPNKQVYSAAQALQKASTQINYALYSVLNFTGAINNVLSFIPQMSTTGAWMRRMTGETAEEYARRVGIEGFEGLAKEGLMPRYSLGLKTMKNLGNKKWRKLVHELAEAESIKTDQAEDIAKFLDPLTDTSAWDKFVKATSVPISFTEKTSRFASFATWFTYAQDAMKMDVKHASKWAARMTEESMAAYSPFVRLGATNHALAQSMMMFKGTATNMLMKNLDMFTDHQYRRIVAANIINMYLFGAKTAPFVSDYQSSHELEDETAADVAYELGAWGNMPWLFAPAVGRKMELRGKDLLSGVEGSAFVGFYGGMAKSVKNAASTLLQGKGARYGWEEVASGLPITAVRNMASATLGYSVSQDHKMIKQADNWQDIAALAMGIQTKKDAMLRNINVVQRAQATRQAEAAKTIRQKFLAASRGGTADDLYMELLRACGHDIDQMMVVAAGLIEDAGSDREARFWSELVDKDPTKIDPLMMQIMDMLISDDTEAI